MGLVAVEMEDRVEGERRADLDLSSVLTFGLSARRFRPEPHSVRVFHASVVLKSLLSPANFSPVPAHLFKAGQRRRPATDASELSSFSSCRGSRAMHEQIPTVRRDRKGKR